MIEYTLPLYATIGKRKPKKVSLTLNWFRNAHFQIVNKIKQGYNPQGKTFNAKAIEIDYVLTLSNNRRTDAMNWITIADKFFLDWLVENKYIPDDNTDHYKGGKWSVEKDTSQPHHTLKAIVKILA